MKCDERYFRIREKQKEFKSVVAELLRLELLKTGIKREEISKLLDSRIEFIVMKGVDKLVELIHSKRSEI